MAVGDGADRPGDHGRRDPGRRRRRSASRRRHGDAAFGGAYQVDALTTFLDLLFIAIIALTIVFGPDYLVAARPAGRRVRVDPRLRDDRRDAASSASTDLLLLFLGLELMVLPGYLLAAFHKTDAYSTEGAIKYFLLGSFSSAIFLFGLAFVWGLTGTTRVDGVAPGAQRDRRRRRAARRPGWRWASRS